jgi:hypothetical protein
MTASPLVSILVPLYNKAEWVEATIQSALGQTYSPIEVLVIDDGSIDRSVEVVSGIDDSRLKLTVRENRGANATRNELLANANGEYVQYLDADDLLLRNKLETQVAALNGGADVSLCRVWRDAPGGERHPDTDILGSTRTLIQHGVHTAAPLHRKSSLEAIEGWNESLNASQEYDLHLRLKLGGHWAQVHSEPEPLAIWRSVPGSTSSDELRVYRAKVESLQGLAPFALSAHRLEIALAITNAARHLARCGHLSEAQAALASAVDLDPAAIAEIPRRMRWVRPTHALLVWERFEAGLRALGTHLRSLSSETARS